VATVRLGYAAAIALRWFQLHGVLRRLTGPAIPARRGIAPETEEEALRQFVQITRYLLDRAEEARGLLTAA
jgi:hypothetical protein